MMVPVGKVRGAASVAQMPQHTSSVKHSDTDNTFQVRLKYLVVCNIHFKFTFRSLCKS